MVFTSLPSAAFHTLTDLSAPPETTRSPLPLKAACVAPSCLPCHTSEVVQVRAVLSAPAVMTRLPSAVNRAACTAPSVGKDSSSRPSRPYTRATLSDPPAISRPPSGLKLTLRTSAGVVTVASALLSSFLVRSQMLTFLSAPPLASREPSLFRAMQWTASPCLLSNLRALSLRGQPRTVLSALDE